MQQHRYTYAMRSLQGKITLIYFALAALIIGLSAGALIELDRIADKAREGSKVAALVDATLEMRRFEKNLLLYGQAQDWVDHARYALQARELLKAEGGHLDILAGPGTTAGLSAELERYDTAMASYERFARDEALANEVRSLGNRIVTVGERLASLERQSLKDALEQHQRNLLAWVGAVVLLLIVTGMVLAHQVARPLQAMEARMEAVARGQLARLALDSSEREFVSLAGAFNHVLDELERRQHTLVRSEKLASLGTLLSGVAHELNNPLSNISSCAQILKEEPDTDAGFRSQLIADIDTETLRARRIVRTLLDYAGDREFKPAPVHLADLVEETLRFVKSRRPPGVALHLDIPASLTVKADRPRLQQALLNLVSNAFDAMGDHGELTLSARLRSADRADDPPVHGGQVVDLFVRDTGPGIPPEQLPRIFDPFFTTKPVGQGSGLGLFITYEILEEHDGCISVANRPEGGTEFHIRLPSASPDQP
jgi:two-component system, NtrC family, sensor kinase